MCRITCIKGNLNRNPEIRRIINEAQQYGSNTEQEIYSDQDLTIILNRFAVTSSKLKHGDFPVVTPRYVFAFNGEIYAFRQARYDPERDPSDGHFALRYIEAYGHEIFFKEADMEGTFFVYDRQKRSLYVYADQLNSKGCFYADTPGNIIISQELSIVKKLLDHCRSKKLTGISPLSRGHCLKVSFQHNLYTYAYKDNFSHIWQGHQTQDLAALTRALKTAVVNRIPSTGRFGLLCSGGVDSSLLLILVTEHLKQRDELGRLVVVTLGLDKNPLTGEENDLKNVYRLLELTGLESVIELQTVFPEPTWDEYLIETAILNDTPHLISPNPAVTQVRHINTMSGVLAQVVIKHPEIKVILSGDFADEIFGGYNSMHTGDMLQLTTNIQEKLDDLQLNDAARVTLASLRGCKYLIDGLLKGRINARAEVSLASFHPVEIRTPYGSHILADALRNFSREVLVGRRGGRVYSKYLLRLMAQSVGVPDPMAWRKKIPFNEGGTGVRNTEPYEQEEAASKKYLKARAGQMNKLDRSLMKIFNIRPYIENNTTLAFEYALYCTSMTAGLEMLCLGKTFRDHMPDSNYASKGNLDNLYFT